MKRSKIFLGVTTTLLAIAGLAATRNAKFNSQHIWYITHAASLGTHVCANVDIACTSTLTPNPICTITVPGPFDPFHVDPTVQTIVYTRGFQDFMGHYLPATQSTGNCIVTAHRVEN